MCAMRQGRQPSLPGTRPDSSGSADPLRGVCAKSIKRSIGSAKMFGPDQALDWLQRKCLEPIKHSIGFSENVWSQSSTRLASAKMFGANQVLDWLQRKCLVPIKYSIGFSENVWCQSSTRLASAKMFGLKQTSNRFRPLSAERSGGLNGYAKNGMRDGAGHAASFLVLTGGKGAKTVETSAKAGKRAERLAQPPRLGRGLSLLSSKRGVATRLRRAWRGRPQRSARR